MSAVVCLFAACRWEAIQMFVGWLWVALRSKWWTDEALQKTHRSQTLQMQPLRQVSVCIIRHTVSNRFWAIHNGFCFIFRCFSRSDHLALHMKRHIWTQIPKTCTEPQRPSTAGFLCIRWVSVLQILHLLAKEIVSAEHRY